MEHGSVERNDIRVLLVLQFASYCRGDAREIPRPAGENAGLRDDTNKEVKTAEGKNRTIT
jgi:hypothetical protein